MSTTLPSSLPPGAVESQHQHQQQQVVVKVKVEQNGCNTPNTPNATKPEESRVGIGVGVGVVVPGEQPDIVVANVPAAGPAAVKSNNNAGFAVARDTSSIPGISMLAGQSYPAAVFKHDEVVASKEVFADALNQFHSVLGTRLT
jgi:hypothetical protein